MISIKTLRIDYDDVTAVKDLNLQIAAGQIYGLVGPNGAGKTSTIKALAGILEPTYGEIKLNNYDLELHHDEALQQVGYMPDFPPVYENLKVWEYLDVFGSAYLMEKSRRLKLSQHWIERVDLTSKWDAYIRNLSRGMRQRLILAKTLLHDPKILLLDEPASGLDPIARKQLRDVLKNVAQEGKTIVISSHILTELSDFCNAIGIMEKGRMVVSGSLEEIRARLGGYSKLHVGLINPQQNLLDSLRAELNRFHFIQDIKQNAEGELEATFIGDKSIAHQILSSLIKVNLPVANFYLKQDNVEDIFFKIGAKEVS